MDSTAGLNFEEKKKSPFSLTGIEPRVFTPFCRLVAVHVYTELYQLLQSQLGICCL
jgi:hypothetical protein